MLQVDFKNLAIRSPKTIQILNKSKRKYKKGFKEKPLTYELLNPRTPKEKRVK